MEKTISVDSSTWRRAKDLAHRNDTTIKQIIDNAISALKIQTMTKKKDKNV